MKLHSRPRRFTAIGTAKTIGETVKFFRSCCLFFGVLFLIEPFETEN